MISWPDIKFPPINLWVLGLIISSSSFAGEFDNLCVTCLSRGVEHVTDCSINIEYNGKTYCFLDEYNKEIFKMYPDVTLGKAEIYYKTLKKGK